MSRKHAGGKCCPAGKVIPTHPDNDILSMFYARRKLAKDMGEHRWQLSDAATVDHHLLIGSGDLSLRQPKGMPEWQKKLGGKPRTKSQKRALKALKEKR